MLLIVKGFAIMSLFAAELEEPRIGIWGKGLNKWNNEKLNDSCYR